MNAATLGWQGPLPDLSPDETLVRVVVEHRGAYEVAADVRGIAELKGKKFYRSHDKRDLPTVGDWLIVTGWERVVNHTGSATILRVLPRNSLLVRKAAGSDAPQPIAANVSLALIMTATGQDVSLPRLDRYWNLVCDAGVTPQLVLTKVDLAPSPDQAIESLASAYKQPVLGISVRSGRGVAELHALLATHTTVLLGSSGVGKSSLMNYLLGIEKQRTKDVAGHKGQHTTTRRELFVLPRGGFVIDTPGMRELGLFGDAPPDEFPEIDVLAADCRFRDCRHDKEIGCAVKAAVLAGTVDAARLASFHKLRGSDGGPKRR